MRIEKIDNVKVFTIFEAPNLDPVTVFMQDVKPSHCRLIIECYGESWTAYWGGMGPREMVEFLLSCNAEYIIGKMETKRMLKRDIPYLKRIVDAVLEALKDYKEENPMVDAQ